MHRNLHKGAEIGIDDFQSDRSSDHRYRTAPLRGLMSHAKGGFYHDGRFPNVVAVVEPYNQFLKLGLCEVQRGDFVEYLKSL